MVEIITFKSQSWIDNYNGNRPYYCVILGVQVDENIAIGIEIDSGYNVNDTLSQYTLQQLRDLLEYVKEAPVEAFIQHAKDCYNQYNRWVGTEYWIEHYEIEREKADKIREKIIKYIEEVIKTREQEIREMVKKASE